MRVAVTGATGLVGSRLCVLLASRGHDVLGICRKAPERTPEGVWIAEVDLADRTSSYDALTSMRPEVIFHAAGLMDPDTCERNPELAYTANVEATANVTRIARLLGAHLVHTSTDYVFDGSSGPYREEDVPNPIGVYPLTKRASEETVLALHPTAAIARTAVVYGWPPSYRMNFGAWLLQSLRAGKEVRLFSDQTVSPTWAGNAAEMIAELGERRLSGIWHTAGGSVIDRVTFGRAFCRVFSLDERLIIPSLLRDSPLTATRPPKAGLLTAKARDNLKAKPLPLDEALARFRAEVESAS